MLRLLNGQHSLQQRQQAFDLQQQRSNNPQPRSLDQLQQLKKEASSSLRSHGGQSS